MAERKTKKDEKFEVVYQEWIESERGWGQRPDGYSLHLTLGDCKKFIASYWDRMPNYVPDEYSAPAGNPTEKFVEREIYQQLEKAKKKGKFGLRYMTIFID